MITLERTEEPHIFTITYDETAGDTDRILTLDEKKNKFGFADRDFYCAVDENLLLSQQKFGRLKNLKALPTNDRRKADLVLQHVFEVMGDKTGTRNEPVYQADLDTLYVAYTVLRPASRPFIKALLENNESYVADESVPEIYTYQPEQVSGEDNEEEADERIIDWGYDDDE
jgi:hypothetical protein